MKKCLILLCLLVLSGNIHAQGILPGGNNTQPIKLKVIEQQYRQQISPNIQGEEDDQDGYNKLLKPGGLKEGIDYQFGRWLWYWQQHLDENGCLVSPMKTSTEWQKYKERTSVAQKLARKTTADQSDWKFEGPDTSLGYLSSGGYFGYFSGIGRINTVAFDPNDTNTIWVGTPGGGAWKSTDGGKHWTAMTDNLPSLSVSDIDFNPLNHNTIYMCTGDRDGSEFYSIGVLKSMDGGTTWDTTGLRWDPAAEIRLADCLIINPLDTNSILVSATDGIYRSYNGGHTFTKVLTGNFKQILYHPTDTNIIYAAGFNGATSPVDAQIYRSADGGTTWNAVTSFTQSFRVSLAVTPADVSVVKAIVSSTDATNYKGLQGIYSSTDTGKTFTEVYTGGCNHNLLNYTPVSPYGCGGQGHYDLCIAISPTNKNLVYIGGVNDFYSTDGGYSWSLLSQWTPYVSGIITVHADKHFMGFSPYNSNKLYEGNDGGIYMSYNPVGGMWYDLTKGLGITQFYSNAVCDLASGVIGGAQDNGSKFLDGKLYADLTGGDGMACQQDFLDTMEMYTSYVYGVIYKVDRIRHPTLPATVNTISTNIPGTPTGAWLTPFLLEPSCNNCIVAGYQSVYESINRGSTWSAISPDLTGGVSGTNVSHLAVTAASDSTIYATISDTNLVYVTYDKNTWYNISVPYSGIVSDIKVDPKDKTHFWITYSGYTSTKVAEYKTSSGWHDISGTLPNVPIDCIQIDTSNNDAYLGTDVGVFFKADTMTDWILYSKNLPVTRVSEININYNTGNLWAATFGRGMWQSPRHIPDTTSSDTSKGISIIPFNLNSLIASPNPNNGTFKLTAKKLTNEYVMLRLVDYTGKTIWWNEQQFDQEGNTTIRTLGLARGIYVLEAIDNKRSEAGRTKVIVY